MAVAVTSNHLKMASIYLQEYTFQCVIAYNTDEVVAVFLYVDADDRINTFLNPLMSQTRDSCTNVTSGYNADGNYQSANTTEFEDSDDIIQSIASSTNVNISGLSIFVIPLCQFACDLCVCVCHVFHSFAVIPTPPSTVSTPTTRRLDVRLQLPNWAVSVWSIGEAIVSYLSGIGTVVLVTCCVNRCKRRRKEKERDVEKNVDNGGLLTKDIELVPGKLETSNQVNTKSHGVIMYSETC